MKSYRLYLCDPDPKFLQRSADAMTLMGAKSTLNSWIRQMGYPVPSRGATLMIVDEADKQVATAGFGATRVRWTQHTGAPTTKAGRLRSQLLEAITGGPVP